MFFFLSNHESTICGIVTVLNGTLPPTAWAPSCLPSHGEAATSARARTALPSELARALPIDGRDERHNGVSLSRAASALRRRSLSPSFGSCPFAVRSIPRSFVQSAWVSHSVHTHGRQIKSKWQTRSNSSKVDQAQQDPSPRILRGSPQSAHSGARLPQMPPPSPSPLAR